MREGGREGRRGGSAGARRVGHLLAAEKGEVEGYMNEGRGRVGSQGGREGGGREEGREEVRGEGGREGGRPLPFGWRRVLAGAAFSERCFRCRRCLCSQVWTSVLIKKSWDHGRREEGEAGVKQK